MVAHIAYDMKHKKSVMEKEELINRLKLELKIIN